VLEEDIILRGSYALLGACHGKVKLVEDFQLLVDDKIEVNADDIGNNSKQNQLSNKPINDNNKIVCAVKTANYWNQYLADLAGIVTVDGSPNAHPMLISRERGLQCIVGCPRALELLRPFDGEWITLDGLRKV
jgi:phosphohistidine swiveling domain-containing protein